MRAAPWLVALLPAALCAAGTLPDVGPDRPEPDSAVLAEPRPHGPAKAMELHAAPPPFSVSELATYEMQEKRAKKAFDNAHKQRQAKLTQRMVRSHQRQEEEAKVQREKDAKMMRQLQRHSTAAAKAKTAAAAAKQKEAVHKAGKTGFRHRKENLKAAEAASAQAEKLATRARSKYTEMRKATAGDKDVVERAKARVEKAEVARQWANEASKRHHAAQNNLNSARMEFYGLAPPPTAPPPRRPAASRPKLPPLPLGKIASSLPTIKRKVAAAAEIVNAAGPSLADAAESIADVVEKRART